MAKRARKDPVPLLEWAAAAVGLVTFNQVMIILSLAILQGSSNSGLWLTRLFQFSMTVAFAVAMMTLAWSGRLSRR